MLWPCHLGRLGLRKRERRGENYSEKNRKKMKKMEKTKKT
jgi:hypothetical protein